MYKIQSKETHLPALDGLLLGLCLGLINILLPFTGAKSSSSLAVHLGIL